MRRGVILLLATTLLPFCAAADLNLFDLEGARTDPFRADTVAVFLFTRTDCPISNRYAPEVQRIHAEFGKQGIAFWLVYVDPEESSDAIREHLKDYSYALPVLRDPEHALVALTGVAATPEAAVFVGRRMIYRGRIDDWYVDFGKARSKASQTDLRDVLQATLDGEQLELRTTRAVGCLIADLE
jgi:peroxiredoxin